MSLLACGLLTLLIWFNHHLEAVAWPTIENRILERRDHALASSPSGNYAPVYAECPQNPFVRAPNEQDNGQAKLGQGEMDYIKEKAAQSIPLWEEYLQNVGLQDFNLEDFLKPAKEKGGLAATTLPNVGFALSGGGARALCFSGYILDAFDSRNERSNEAKVGGILQLANYAVAVSGANWLLGSWATANFPRISTLLPNWRLSEENDLWDWNMIKHYPSVYKIVEQKHKAGFPVSLVDAWGRILCRHFIDQPGKSSSKQGADVLWSSIRETSGYQERVAPFVMSVTTSRPGKRTTFTPESPTYEFTPEEFGLFHPALNASIPIDLLGTPPVKGAQPATCVRGFDNAGFIMAMSSNIFSQGDSPKGSRRPRLFSALAKFIHDDDFEGKVPNTFKGLGKSKDAHSPGFPDNDVDTILMADSGFIHENVPLFPLLQPERKLDVIIAVDASADGKDAREPTLFTYPNGTSLYTIYLKTKLASYSGYHMPRIPNPFDGTFTQLGYNQRPTFFGCEEVEGPLIVYLPNYYATGKTNIATAKTTYTPEEIDNFLANGFAIASQTSGSTQNPRWPACLACALIDRQVLRNAAPRSSQCQQCFAEFCAPPT